MEMRIGANIKRLRTAKNITQEQLSAAMNITCAAVSKWERGEIIERGNHEKLIAEKGTYYQLYTGAFELE